MIYNYNNVFPVLGDGFSLACCYLLHAETNNYDICRLAFSDCIMVVDMAVIDRVTRFWGICFPQFVFWK